jgi:hypothetical protein
MSMARREKVRMKTRPNMLMLLHVEIRKSLNKEVALRAAKLTRNLQTFASSEPNTKSSAPATLV